MTAPPQISTLSPYTTLFRSKGGGRGGRQPPPREGGKKKGRPAVQAGRVRHHLRRRNLLGRDRPRRGPRAEDRPEVGLLLQLRGRAARPGAPERDRVPPDRKSTRLNSSHSQISYAVFCLNKKN